MIHEEIDKIANHFKTSKNFDGAHELSIPVLKDLVKDKDFLFDVVRKNLSNPEFLKKTRHYPTLAMEVFKNDIVDMVINIFPSLPDQRTDISFQSIHHHGSLKLSTVGLSGPGYSSCIFKKGYAINKETNETNLELEKFYSNKIGQYTFCDAYVPHVVFYPTQMSSTLVLWSKQSQNSINFVKALFPRSFSKSVGPVLNKLGLRKTLDLNVAQYHDFYPENGKFYALKDRIGYPEGSNENFIQNFFYYLQTIGFDDFDFLRKLLNSEQSTVAEKKWIEKYCSKEVIKEKFEEIHYNIDSRVNNNLDEIKSAFESH